MAKLHSSFNFLFQAIILPSKNPKLFFQLFFISIIYRMFLYLINYLLTNPLSSEIIEISKEISTTDPTSPEFLNLVKTLAKDAKEFLILQILYLLFLFLFSFIISIIAYFAFSATYLGEILTIKEVFNKVKANIKGPLITQVIITLFNVVYFIILFGVLFTIVRYFSTSYSTVWAVILYFWFFFILLYLSIIWSMSMVISVIETSQYGFNAISRAMKLLKGRKMQIFILIFISVVLSTVIYGFNYIIAKFAPSSMACSIILGCFLVIFGEGLALYNMSAVTILYYECNSQNSGEVGDKVSYNVLPNTDIV
ncbi:hypothetical protein LUZ60_008847 [Juncus effusus]|nr:hypothetical protein LUZ60_008847 [Juncus effusus]